ncbi:MAG: hypothetical protein R3E14_04755 [Erythrobacter sp.]
MHSDWYLFKDLKRKPLQRNNWIPLRAIEHQRKIGTFGNIGYLRDTFACGSVAIPIAHRELAERLGWSDIGLIHETRPYADEDGYKPADKFLLDWSEPEPSGVSLVINQSFGFERPAEWHLHQDLVIALGLIREGDVWVRPDEDFIDVVRMHKDNEGEPKKIEIRTEFLRDYLKARKMALRIAWYRDRDSIIDEAEQIDWRDEPPTLKEENYRFEARFHEVHKGSGMPFGGQTAVFTARRTDVYPEDDVPEFDEEGENNTSSESRTFGDPGEKVFRVEGEIWAEEWIEPAQFSPRVAYDKPPSSASFIVDTSGTRETADVLDDEDIGKYLWFRPDVANDILGRRNGSITWYTKYTGAVQLTYGYPTHFGINDLGLLNTYAYDVAKLPEWQRIIWQGYNVAPDGGVCRELLAAQMEVNPAGTLPPEKHIPIALRDLEILFGKCFEGRLFRDHAAKEDILGEVHRFRALRPNGLYDLAKDVTRLVTEDLDVKSLHKIAPPEGKDGRGSLKSLERLVAKELANPEDAAHLLSFMHAIYALRGMTSHLPSSDASQDPFRMLGIDANAPTIEQGRQLLHATMYFLAELARLLFEKSKS